MTRIDPSLRLDRLIVLKGGEAVYDERFHLGVNIIRGENSTGKSTIADLIFFALGGEVRQWKEEAESCDRIFAEISINGGAVTLQREISAISQRPMSVFIGAADAALNAQMGWVKLPFGRKGEKESYSQLLFRLFGIPEVPGEAGENLTMHQCLRLMYVDQMTPPDRIFRAEMQWDSPLKRQAVGDFLCGVLDHRIYENELLLRERERDFELVARQLTGLFDVLNEVEHQAHLEEIKAERENLKKKRVDALAKLDQLKKRRFESKSDGKGQALLDELRTNLEKLNAERARLEQRIGELEFAIADAAFLISEIEKKLRAIHEGRTTRESVGALGLSFCPVCYTPIADGPDDGHCVLCKSAVDPKDEETRYLRMKNELVVQQKESLSLQVSRRENLRQLRVSFDTVTKQQVAVRSQFLSLSHHYVHDVDIGIDDLSRQIGYFDRDLEDVDRREKQAAQIKSLTDAKGALAAQIATLKEEITQLKRSGERRRAEAFGAVSRNTAMVLALDLPSEDEFNPDSSVAFSFGEDRIAVNGKAGYSASSLVVIRNAFHLALLATAARDSRFLYPRFVLMDNIEDKGMNQPRSRNFQRRIVELSDSIQTEHQIIFTTSMIAPELEQSSLVVGEHYTFNNKSLKMSKSRPRLI